MLALPPETERDGDCPPRDGEETDEEEEEDESRGKAKPPVF